MSRKQVPSRTFGNELVVVWWRGGVDTEASGWWMEVTSPAAMLIGMLAE